jgi:catechol 2,3-dioxygenase-like lactoylglutathione lyase family enzyme
MFTILNVFHVTHVVDDLDAALRWYDDVFATGTTDRTEFFGTALSLLTIGNVTLMPMQPGDATSPGRFKARFGEHLHSLAIYVDGPVSLIEHLKAAGFFLTGPLGEPVERPDDEIWTQPKESPMVFEFFEYRPSMVPASEWRDHPLAARGAVYTNVVDDPSKATAFYVDLLRGEMLRQGVPTPYESTSDFVRVGDDVVIELARPTSPNSPAARDLDAGTTFHAVTFTVDDLDRAADHLTAKGVRLERPAGGHLVCEPADTLGMVMRFTDRDPVDW